jgi:hypothetical protein
MSALTAIVAALNAGASALGGLLYPIGLLPGWLSATLVAVLTGVLMLLVFKYTSNQRGIKRVRASIRANLLAVKLFKDDIRVGLRAQRRVVFAALHLLLLAVVPFLVMVVPTFLLLAQLGAWYQAAPLPVGEETVVTVRVSGEPGTPLPEVELVPTEAVEDLSGPVRATSAREVCWSLRARTAGYHVLQFRVDGQTIEKELAIGTGVMRVSPVRPERVWSKDLALVKYPRERPFDRDSVVRSISIEYPTRDWAYRRPISWTSGTDVWIAYWIIVSLVAGFALRGVLGVNI